MDYHTIGFRECASEVERYLSTYENIDELFKQRVVTHLKGCSADLSGKDGNNNSTSNVSNNNVNSSNNSKNTVNKKRPNSKLDNNLTNTSIKSNEFNNNHNNLQNLHHNITYNTQNNHNISHHSLPLSPPSSSVSPSTLSSSSSSSVTTTSNSLESNESIYHIPFALLKSKKLSFNSTLKQANKIQDSINSINNYKPNQTIQNFNLNTLKCL